MKKIIVDMDDVLTFDYFTNALEEYLGYKLDFKDFKGFKLQDLLGDKKGDFFLKFRNMDMYKNATLAPHCYEVLKELNNYYEIYICTDYVWNEMIDACGNVLKSKYEFLFNKLDFINPRNYIFTSSKDMIHGDVRIDDRVRNLMDDSVNILFSAWHNVDEENLEEKGIIRVKDWSEIGEILLREYK